MKKQRVLLVTVTSELPRYFEYYDSIDRLILPPNTGKTSIHSSSPAANRNIAILNALKHDFTHIFFTDDDHVFPPDTVMRLLSHEVDIVSGLYCMKFPPFPIIVLNNPNEKNMSAFIDIQKIGAHGLYEVPRVPAGCLLVTTDSLRAIQGVLKDGLYNNKWFTIGQIQSDQWGDDLWFCDRARDAGINIYVDSSVRVGHITKCILTPEYINGEWVIQHKINSAEGIDVKAADTK